MLGIVMMSYMQSLTAPRGMVLGSESRPHLLNKRWRTVPAFGSSEVPYEWELESKFLAPGSTFTLRIFRDDGVELRRSARCPLFVDNLIAIDSTNITTSDPIVGFNTVYYIDADKCVLQNSWFTGMQYEDSSRLYFLNKNTPLMTSVPIDNPQPW
jgi:hypothetical protein